MNWIRTRAERQASRRTGLRSLSIPFLVAIAVGLAVGPWTAPAAASSPLSWSLPENVDGSNGLTMTCPSSSLCVAGDNAGPNSQVLTSTDPLGGAGTWTAATVTDAHNFFGMSCPSESLCVGIAGGDVVTSANPTGGGGAWAVKPGVSAGTLYGISCPSSSLCVATDNTGKVFTSDNPGAGTPSGSSATWTSAGVESSVPWNVSCPSSSLCVGVDYNGQVTTSTDPTGGTSQWTAPATVDAGNHLNAVSCPSTTLCVATDDAGNVVTSSDPTGGPLAWTRTGVGAGSLSGVSCSNSPAVLCVAGSNDDNGNVVTSTDPTGGAAAWTVEQVDGSHEPFSPSCPTSSLCVVGDDSGNVIVGREIAISHALTVSLLGSGKGSVTGPGISCSPTCSRSYAAGTALTLTANSAAGSGFAGWGGDCSGIGACHLSMDKPRSVSAKFVLPPNTAITKTKVNKKKHKATFKFSSTGGGGTIGFECKLDHRHFKPCSSPKTYKHLKAGKHTFRVRSRNEAGADASPAKKKFRIPKRHK